MGDNSSFCKARRAGKEQHVQKHSPKEGVHALMWYHGFNLAWKQLTWATSLTKYERNSLHAICHWTTENNEQGI